MSENEEKPQDTEATDAPFGEVVGRKTEEFEPSRGDGSYEMDPETKAAFERVMKKHHKAIKRLANDVTWRGLFNDRQ